ncbi:Diguanylate cyclase [Pseudomonas sp. M47T1]|uniref:GGDEF domain-containing protein n=1 Tax=Pseudomonas sp. M47T1 TaxID=1179778 RepID=UPI0002606B54|nr:sensor domain-containing diguanylate cyclase [Pseudomonas sp. M47T1]EIK96992.1 Diguanylate cyclase [Pseudomonas sp. M47T1]
MDQRARQYQQDVFIAEQVRNDQLQQLFRQSGSAVFGSYLAAVMLSWLCWGRFDHQVVGWWLGLLSASTLLRTSLFVRYFRSVQSERIPGRWEWQYWSTLASSAAIWGVGALAVMPPDDLLAQALVMLFAVGMSVSAVSCYSAYRHMTVMSILLVLLPSTVWLLLQDSTIQVGMALAALVFAFFVARATQKLSEALERAYRLSHEMERAHSISTYAAQTDELTGLKNRRAFFEHGHQLFTYCQHQRVPLCAVMLDMDHFKHINDTYGHQAGDEVLRQIGRVISGSLRATDIHGRLGGEEFAVLLPDTSLAQAQGIAEQLLRTIADLRPLPVYRITASLGVAEVEGSGQDLHKLINNADKALYRAKAQGRNQVVIAEPA